MSHPFIVGERYMDRRGEYEVISIDPPNLTVRYDDGAKQTATLDIKARIYQNMLAEQSSLHPYQSAGYFTTLGFLATRADFHAEVPPQSQSPFEEKYFLLTGIRPQAGQNNYFPITITTTYDKWGPELRIYFPDKGGKLELPPSVDVREGRAPGTLRINNNDFWWKLVRAGFRLGTAHEVDRIRSGVPVKHQRDFDAGR